MRTLIENIIQDIVNNISDQANLQQKLYTVIDPHLVALFENALKSEHEALEIYYELLAENIDNEDKMKIQEIISDEENHKKILETIVKKYSQIPPSKN